MMIHEMKKVLVGVLNSNKIGLFISFKAVYIQNNMFKYETNKFHLYYVT